MTFVFFSVGDYSRALSYVDDAISHTPTTVDLYVLKARIYKHAGDHQTAYKYMDVARLMDTADRYLNTKCVRYAWRADLQSEAEKTILLFLRDGDGLAALTDLQVCWYALASGQSYYRQQQWGKALKKLTYIDKVFEDIYEDQFDFHQYCLRKMTLRVYVSMLRWEDELRNHKFFTRAAQLIVEIYLRIADEPKEKELAEEELTQGLTEEEKKLALRKAKR